MTFTETSSDYPSKTYPHHGVSDSLAVSKHLRRRNTDRLNSTRGNISIAANITLRMLTRIVRLTVNFECQLCFGAIEIECIWTKRMITADFDQLLLSKLLP